MFDYAIELGGGYTTIFKRKKGFVLKEPTMVAVEKIKNDFRIKAFGKEAKDLVWKTPESIETFNPISNGVIENYEYALSMLKYFLKKVDFKPNKQSAMVLANCGSGKEEKKLFRKLFEEVGFIDLSFIPSIICSAVGCGRNISTHRASLVVNVGSSTTEVSAMNMDSIIQGVSLGIGGKMIDIEIANNLAINKKEDNFLVGLPTAEKIKNEVGSLHKNDTLNIEVLGTNLTNRLPSAKIVASKDVKGVIQSHFEEIIRTIEVTINTLPPEIAQDIINNGIVFTGGLANLAGLDVFLKKNLKFPFVIAENPEDVTIMGAGKLLSDSAWLKKILAN